MRNEKRWNENSVGHKPRRFSFPEEKDAGDYRVVYPFDRAMARDRGDDLAALLERARRDRRVLAVMLFGSRARGESTPGSDIDVCLLLEPGPYEDLFLSRVKLDYLKDFDLDIHVFQQLPLYIRHRVLKEGKALFCRDEDKLYDLAFRTIREFEDFKHIYREYLEGIAHG